MNESQIEQVKFFIKNKYKICLTGDFIAETSSIFYKLKNTHLKAISSLDSN